MTLRTVPHPDQFVGPLDRLVGEANAIREGRTPVQSLKADIAKGPSPGLVESVGAAFRIGDFAALQSRINREMTVDLEPVEGFNGRRHADEQVKQGLIDPVVDDWWFEDAVEKGVFDEAENPDQFEFDLERTRAYYKDAQILAEAGINKALGAGLIAGIADPVNLIPFGALANAGRRTRNLAKTVSTTKKVAKLSAAGGGINLASEIGRGIALPAANDEGLGNEALATVAGAMFGGFIGLITASDLIPSGVGKVKKVVQKGRLKRMAKDYDEMLRDEAVVQRAPADGVKTDEDLGRNSVQHEVAEGAAYAQKILDEEPVDGRSISILNVKGDANHTLLQKAIAKYDKEGLTLHVVEHPEQRFFENLTEVNQLLKAMGGSFTEANPTDFTGNTLDLAIRELTNRYSNLQLAITPGGRISQVNLGNIQEIYRSLSGSARTLTKGNISDDFNFESPLPAEQLKAGLEVHWLATNQLARQQWSAFKKGGLGSYNGKPIKSLSEFMEATSEYYRANAGIQTGKVDTLPTDTPAEIRVAAEAIRTKYFQVMANHANDAGLLRGDLTDWYLPRQHLTDAYTKNRPDAVQTWTDDLTEGRDYMKDPETGRYLRDKQGKLVRAESPEARQINDRAWDEVGSTKNQAMTRDELTQRVKEEFPELSINSGSRDPSNTLGISEADRMLDRISTMEVDEPDRDYARLLGRVFIIHRKGGTNSFLDGQFVKVKAGDLADGDEFQIGDETFRVVGKGETVTIERLGKVNSAGDLETDTGEIEIFSVKATDQIPINQASRPQEVGFRPRTEGEIPADLKERYELAVQNQISIQARDIVDGITDPSRAHALEDGMGNGNPLKKRKLDILDENRFDGLLEKDVIKLMASYHRHVAGAIAVRRAIKLNGLDRLKLKNGHAVVEGSDLITLIDEQLGAVTKLAAEADRRLGREGRKAMAPKAAKIQDRIRSDFSVTTKVLEGRWNPGTKFGSGLDTAGRLMLQASFMSKMGSVVWNQLNDAMPQTMFLLHHPMTIKFIPRAIREMRSAGKRDLTMLRNGYEQYSRLEAMGDLDPNVDNVGRIERAMQSGSEKVAKGGGLTPVLGLMKHTASMFVTDSIVRDGKKLLRAEALVRGGMDKAEALRKVGISQFNAGKINQMGFTNERTKRFLELVYEHGRVDDGSDDLIKDLMTFNEFMLDKRGSITEMDSWNINNATDRELMEVFAAGVNGRVENELVVTPAVFDRPLIMYRHPILGRMFNQFQGYMFAFTGQRLKVMAQMPAKYQTQQLAFFFAAGAMTDAISNHLAGRRSFDETAELWGSNPLGMSYAAVERSALMGWFSRYLAMADQMGVPFSPGVLLDNTVGSRSARNISNPLGFLGPVAGDMATVIDLIHAALGDREWGVKESHMFRKLLPFQNLAAFRILHRSTGVDPYLTQAWIEQTFPDRKARP